MPPLPNIVCKACGYVNEGERVYCHGCGAKLDRELIISQQPSVTPEQKQREVRKIMAPKSRIFPGFWKNLARSVALGAVAATIIVAAMPPEGVPAAPSPEAMAPQLDVVLEDLASLPDGKRKGVTEADLNVYLQKEHFKKVPEWLKNTLQPRRVFVNLGDGGGRIGVEASLFGYPLYAALSGQVRATGPGQWTQTCTGGAIGRLAIHPVVACHAKAALPVLLDSFKRDRQMLDKLGSVEIVQGRLVLGAVKAAPAPAAPPAVRPGVSH